MAADRESQLRRVRQKLESARSAGIEWLPKSAMTARPAPTTEVKLAMPSLEESPSNQPAAALSPNKRKIELTILAEQVAGCTRCKELASTRTQTVFGTGPLNPEICFVGEAPGADEDKQGEPFVGKAGELLTKIILACGLKREEVYIMNTLKCRPPGNRTPRPDETANCREYFDRQLELVRPKYIVALGGTAAQNLLKVTTPIGKLRGVIHDVNGVPMIVTYHPAYLLPHRAPEKKKEVWDDMKMLLGKLGRPIPEVKSDKKDQ